MASTSSPESDVSSTTVQVTSIGGQQIFQSGGQQYLIVNKGLQGSGGRIQIVDQAQQDSASAAKFRREILARQPSYCKILNDLAGNDLKEVESSESEDTELSGEAHRLVSKQEKEEPEQQGQGLVMKGETIEVVEGSPSTQTVLINGQAYQIVSPVNAVNLASAASSAPSLASPVASGVQFTSATASGGTNGTSSGSGSLYISAGAGAAPHLVSVPSNGSTAAAPPEEQTRKREIRLMKNREAARECRNKKKEYIKCLENRVAVLENQNKALIEELKSLKELYTGQKN